MSVLENNMKIKGENKVWKDIIDKKYVYFCLEDCNFNCDDLWTELHWTLRSGML